MTTATSAPEPPDTTGGLPGAVGTVRWLFLDAAIVTRRNLRHFQRQPRLLLLSTVQPVMFVLLFAYVFGGAIGGSLPSGVDYVSFLLPGIFVQATTFRASQTAVGLSEDLKRGVIDRFRAMPVSRSAVLAGRTLADLIRNVFIVLLMVAVGYLIGFRFTGGIVPAVGAILLVSLFGFALSWIFAAVGLIAGDAESAQTAGFIVIFPLVFASSVFVPISSMPGWLQAFATISPVTLVADASRAMSIGVGAIGDPLLGALAWTLAILGVFVPLAVLAYRRLT